MEVSIIHHTVDKLNDNSEMSLSRQAIILAGREAGICYGSDNYFSKAIKNTESAMNRADKIKASGHHSPFDHFSIGLEITGIPKILAMMLNSTEFYTTSEKSARYTVMHPDTDKEQIVYNKWANKFQEIISSTYGNITGKDCEKLALENARYMISVFTPTSMGYTTTFRQLSYMTNWLNDLCKILSKSDDKFDRRMLNPCAELRDKLYELTGGYLKDKNNGYFKLMRKQYGKETFNQPDSFGEVYQISYLGSFAHLAQAHRHRTIHYEMEFNTETNYGCYIPLIIKDNEKLRNEWLEDFESLKDCFPQCSLVRIIEQGRADDFLNKCYERLCGRAQLEIAKQTEHNLKKFVEHKDRLLDETSQRFLSFMPESDKKVCPKCGTYGYKCQEPCRWGREHGLDRLI